jgi:hypothetical protein
MASDKKLKTDAPKTEPQVKDKTSSGESPAKTASGESPAKTASGESPAKAEGSAPAAAAPANYSRGEGQKPVTQAYKDNWNAIFAKKKKKR